MTVSETLMKRALYRAHHRGTKEMDLVLGRFADAELGRLDAAGLAAFEALLALPDPDIDRWIKGEQAPPGVAPMIALIRRHHRLES
jgi:antitoxin CptB